MKRLVVFLFLWITGQSAFSQSTDTALWIPNGPVNSVWLRDSLLYVGGTFSQVTPCTGHFVGVDANSGNVVSPFPFVSGRIDCMVRDSLGYVYVGGAFSSVGTYNCSNLFRLTPQGQFDPNFLPNPDGEVFAIAIEWHNIFIGGDFSTVSGFARGRLAAIEDTTLTLLPFDGRASGPVYSICPDTIDDAVLVGGNFNNIGGGQNQNIAKLQRANGNYLTWGNLIWSAVPLVNGVVRCVRLVGDTVYLAGDFSGFGNLTRKGIAMLDLTTGNVGAINAGTNGTVRDIEIIGDRIYLGGNFTIVGGQLRNNLACVNLNFNIFPWNPSANSQVYDLSVYDSTSVCVGGNFTLLGTDTCYRAGIIDTAGLGFVHPFNSYFNAAVMSVIQATTTTGKFWAGGDFYGAGGVLRSNFCVINVNTKQPSAWAPKFGNTITTIYGDNNLLFVSGNFSSINLQNVGSLVAFDLNTNTLTTFNPGVNGLVRTMKVVGQKLYVGGNFSMVGTQPRNNIACIDIATSTATAWNPNCTGTVNKIVADGNHLYVGGFYSQIGGQFRDNLARIDQSTGLADFGWVCNTDDGIYDMSLYNGQLYFGGWFAHVNGQLRNYLAAVDTSGTLSSFNPAFDNYIHTIERWNGDLFISGVFNNVGGNLTRPRLCNYDVDNVQFGNWIPAPNIFPQTMQPSQNWLYIGGTFSSAGFHYHPHLAMISINYVTGIPTQPSTAIPLQVWPNPADNFVFVSTENHSTKTTLQVMDVNGQLLSEQIGNSDDGVFKIDLTNLSSGMYFIRVVDEEGNVGMEKVIRQ